MTYQNALTALADPTRRHIFESLRRRPTSVGDLAGGLPVSRPAVSQHLRVLKEAGLVNEERDGSRRVYCISIDGLADLRDYIEGFWEDVLDSFSDAIATESGGTDGPDED